MRVTTKPSTAKCDLNTYTLFLLAESKYPGCTRLAEIMEDLSHDSVNRFLLREQYEPLDLFNEVKPHINLVGGTLSGDDTVIDKAHSEKLTELIGYFYSGRHHRTVKGIQLITLYYTDVSGKSVPVNYRIYNKQDGKTKNDYLREMITEVLEWGLEPKIVTTDAWYSSQKNLKFLKNQELGFLTGIAKNRSCSVDGKNFIQVQNLEIPETGLIVYLKKFGQVKVFRRDFKNEAHRYYIMYVPDLDALFSISMAEFKELHSIHWGIECYHRAIKQVCGIERFMVRTSAAIRTHFFSAIRAFTQLELMRIEELIENWYEVQRNLSLHVARDFILEHLKQQVGLNAHSQFSVNA
ncbi:transposase [Scytonema hofmannii PCC 7110]|uniref:Transposase n=2 Tax=Scytonema hofmannii PCC 7110 TaxID=128403 RepID=A0A139X3A6_9CYAN|nr:transposase [Scytonema hofmannii]KYC37487.1 transposase [Scytonema hofmannii PCC 7110]KYC39154.1 transposase [Scytonema hofmannii PCC 7110]KYC40975.1 transposase [Scytonema hofmannii PCC 7110]KYC42553.1 transposase [Scytonema hofmannii PCC 7110]